MFRTILVLEAARRTAEVELTELMRRCAAESGLEYGLMTVHALDAGFGLTMEAAAPATPGAGRRRGLPVPFLALPTLPAPAVRDALLLDIHSAELQLTGTVRLINLDAADRPARVLVRIGTASETSGPAPDAWEQVFTRTLVRGGE